MKRENVTIVNLESNRTRLPLRVSMESFFDFSFWLAEELDDLVADQQLQQQRNEDVNQRALRQIPKRLPVPMIKRLPR